MVEYLVAAAVAILAVFQGVDSALNLVDRLRRGRSSKIEKLSSQTVSAERVMLEADTVSMSALPHIRSETGVLILVRTGNESVVRELVEVLTNAGSAPQPSGLGVSEVETWTRNEIADKEPNDHP